MKNPNIILIPTEGLCNRLRAMASAHILANHLKSKFFIVWEKEECCFCELEDIFSNHFETTDFNSILDTKYFYSPQTHTNSIMHKLHEFDNIVIKGGHEFKHPEIPVVSFLKQKQQFYQSLIFSNKVNRTIDNYDFDMSECVGIHFRDYLPKYDALDNRDFSKISPIESFVELIKQIYAKNANTRFLISSNTDKAIKQIKEIIPKENIYTMDNLDTSRNTSTGVIHAMANLIYLSRCKYIIGTLMSSYSDEACFFNCISKICIGNEDKTVYHCHGYAEVFNYKMLLPNVNILYDMYKEAA